MLDVAPVSSVVEVLLEQIHRRLAGLRVGDLVLEEICYELGKVRFAAAKEARDPDAHVVHGLSSLAARVQALREAVEDALELFFGPVRKHKLPDLLCERPLVVDLDDALDLPAK